jgi:hypothetical protein
MSSSFGVFRKLHQPAASPPEIMRKLQISGEERFIEKVIQELLTVIPKKEEILITELKNFNNSYWNQAPELLFNILGNILNNNVQNIDEAWKVKLVKIFNGILKVDIIAEDLCKKVFHPNNEGKLWNLDEA